jgi:ABC-2 type transport system permease protein
MRNIVAIARREVGTYFSTTMGWLVLCAFLLITGFFFASMVSYYAVQSSQMAGNAYGQDAVNLNEYLVAPFFANMGVILLMLCPALSMRLFAEDRHRRSLELLLTSPVSTLEIVLGKFLGGMGFVLAMLAATVHYPLILYWLGSPDTGVLLCAYLSVILMVSAFMAVGLLASAFTESQVVALVVSFALLLLFWVLSWASSSGSEGMLSTVLTHVSMISHLEEMSKGLIHVKDLVYYFSFVAVFLFATWQRVEAYRWR